MKARILDLAARARERAHLALIEYRFVPYTHDRHHGAYLTSERFRGAGAIDAFLHGELIGYLRACGPSWLRPHLHRQPPPPPGDDITF